MYLDYSFDLGFNLIEIRYICVFDYFEWEKMFIEWEDVWECFY